jgi:hypothetical protein
MQRRSLYIYIYIYIYLYIYIYIRRPFAGRRVRVYALPFSYQFTQCRTPMRCYVDPATSTLPSSAALRLQDGWILWILWIPKFSDSRTLCGSGRILRGRGFALTWLWMLTYLYTIWDIWDPWPPIHPRMLTYLLIYYMGYMRSMTTHSRKDAYLLTYILYGMVLPVKYA